MRPMTSGFRRLSFRTSLLGGAALFLGFALVLGGEAPQTWTPLAPSGGPPAARMVHTAVYSQTNNRMIVFGGFKGDPDSGSCGPSCLNDVWVLANADGTGGAPSWTQLSPTGAPPSARGTHSAVYDAASNRMVVYGGDPHIGFCGGAVNDVWVLTNADGTGGTPNWTQLFPSGTLPDLRQGPTGVYDSATNRMIVFGGRVNAGCAGVPLSNNVWVLTNANGLAAATPAWTQLSPVGPGPAARQGHASVYDAANNRMIVFGGTTSAGLVNDVWVLQNANGVGGTPAWTELTPAGGLPTARSAHSAVYDPATKRMVVFGGQATGGLSNQIWELTNANGLGGTSQWTQRTPAGGPPSARDSHTAVLNTATNRMTVYAGRSCIPGDCFAVGDVWVLSGAVAPVVTTLTLTPAEGFYSGTTDLQATLLSSGGAISGATVGFTIDGLPVGSATTNSSGIAMLSGISLAGRSAGTYPGIVGASFAATPGFQNSSGTGDLTVSRATPSIAWPFPLAITHAAPLGSAQLNATATFNSLPLGGTFVYAPTAGTVLSAGINQTLSTSFEPTDTANYETVTANALITVNPSGTSTIVQSSPTGSSVFGAPLTFTATVAAVAPGTGTPTGAVQFKDNGTPIGGAVALASGVATINSSVLTVGGHAITADYIGNGNYKPSGGSSTKTVNQASSLTTIVSSATPSVFGQSVTLTATVTAVSPSSGTPTGTVTFDDGGAFIVTATLDGAGHATAVTGTLSVGSHVIAATYTGDAGFTGSAAQSPVWQQLAPTGAGPDVNSQQFVSDGHGSLIMFGGCGPTGCNGSTGTVALRDAFGVGGTTQWVQIPTAGGSPGARHAHVLAYDSLLNELIVSGGCAGGCFPVADSTWKLSNGNGLGGGTPTWSQVIAPAPPANGFIGGQFAAVDSAHSALMIFGGQNGGGSACSTTGVTASVNTSTFTWASLPTAGGPPGAQYLATGGYDPGSNRLIVANGWGCGLFNELWILTHANGKDAGFTPTWTKLLNQGAEGSPPGGPAGRGDYSPARNVMFLVEGGSPSVPNLWRLSNANGLGAGGAAATPAWTLATTTGGPGGVSNVGGIAYDAASDRIVAQLTVGSGVQYWIIKSASGSGASVSQAVTPASTTTSIASDLNPSMFGQSVTFTAAIGVAAPGSGMPTGTVTFKDGATTLGTGTLSAGTATFTTSSLTVVSHPITAVYGGDTNFTTSTSSPLSQTVSRLGTTTEVMSSHNPSVFGQSVMFTATVAVVAPGLGTPAGTVTFKDGATTLGTGTLSAGTASFTSTTTALSAGSHSIAAFYDGDITFSISASSALAQIVNPAPPPTALFTANPNPAACHQSLTFNGSGSDASPGLGITSYAWHFGDGSSASGQSVTHSYGSYGTYTSALTVTDNNVPAQTATTTQTITVNQGNMAPLANAGGSYIVTYGGSVQLNGIGSSDPNAGCGDSIVSYTWTIDGTISLSGSTATLNTAVNPLSAGVHAVSLTVTDTFGAASTVSTVVNVQPALVSIEVNPSMSTIGLGEQQPFQAIGHFNDGSTALLPSGGTGGGGSGQGSALWSMHLTPGLNIDVCATSQYPASSFIGGIAIHGFTPDAAGNVHTTWSMATPVVNFDGAITPAEVNLTLTCTGTSAAPGSLHAVWTGLRYEGTATFNGGATAVQVAITGWSSRAAKPTGRFGLAAVPFGGKVFAIGGVEGSCGGVVGCSLSGPSTTVESYDPATDTWAAEPSLNVGRSSAGAAALGGKIYVVGGQVPGGELTNMVEVFDPSSNSWTTLPQSEWMPTARAGLAVVTDGTYLYAIGGSTQSGIGGQVAIVERYDPVAHTWSTLAPMPVAGTASAGVLNGTIVVFGSDGSTRTDIYDIATNTWHAGVPMPAQRGGMSVAAANGGLWLVGGTSNGALTYSTWVYYPATVLKPEGFAGIGSMLTARSQAAAASVGDVVFLVGGMAFGPNPVLGLSANEALSTLPIGDLSTSQGPSDGGAPSAILWHSTNSSVATIDQNGFATGVAMGNATIVASAGSITCLPDACSGLAVINTVPSVQIFGGPFSTNESQFQNFGSGGSFSDRDPQTWTATVDYGDATGTQTLSLFNLQSTFTPTAQFNLNHAYRDNGVFTVTVTVDDHSGGVGTATAQVTVNNVVPQVSLPTMPPPTTQLGSLQNFGCAAIFDQGTLDGPWSATVDYGDGAGPQPVTNLVGSCGGSGGPDLVRAFNLSHVYTSAGTFTVTATAKDKDGAVGTSTTSVTVNKAMPSMNLTVSPSGSITYGQNVTFTAMVTTSLPGVASPTGIVIFTVDGTQVAAPSLVSGQASYSTSSLTAGVSHNIVATYGGDASFNSRFQSTSRFIGRISPSMTFTSSSSSSTLGQAVTFTATVADPNGVVTATGPITFTIDGNQVASPILMNGQAIYSTSSLSIGSHNISVNYPGDAHFFSSFRSISHSVNACQGSVRGTILNHGAPFTGPVQFVVTVGADTFPFMANGGAFYFDEVDEGGYHLQVVPPAGLTAIPAALDFSVSCGQETALIFEVADTTPPVITLNGSTPITLEGGSTFTDPGATATDAIAGNLTSAIVATGAVDTTHVGSYTRTYTVSDGYNSTSKARVVNVIDTTPPTFTSPPNATIDATTPAGATYFYATPTAVDAVLGAVTMSCNRPAGSVFPIGTTIVTCTAKDQAGNSTVHTFTVTVLNPQEVIANLILQVGTLNFQQANNLLQNVLHSLDRSNANTACNQLGAFINQVQAQAGHQLTAGQAASLIQSASDARGTLGCQ